MNGQTTSSWIDFFLDWLWAISTSRLIWQFISVSPDHKIVQREIQYFLYLRHKSLTISSLCYIVFFRQTFLNLKHLWTFCLNFPHCFSNSYFLFGHTNRPVLKCVLPNVVRLLCTVFWIICRWNVFKKKTNNLIISKFFHMSVLFCFFENQLLIINKCNNCASQINSFFCQRTLNC